MQIEQAKMQTDQQTKAQELQQKINELQAELQREQIQQQGEDRRTQAEIDARLAMNESDNQTAKQLAALEVQSGDKIALSTGHGINPNP